MNAPDPEREKVERADAILRESQGVGAVIDDPTVFVKGAALGALTLVELAKLGENKAQDAKVRDLARQLRERQQAIRKELAAIAGRKRLDVPGSLVHQDEQMLADGAGKSAAEFDAWFTQQAYVEHLKAIGLYESAERMTDAQLAEFAGRTLKQLEGDRATVGALLP